MCTARNEADEIKKRGGGKHWSDFYRVLQLNLIILLAPKNAFESPGTL